MAIGLRRLSPELQTRVLELGAFLHPTIAPWIFTAYRKTVVHQPRLYGMMYRHQYHKSLNRFAQLALHRLFYASTAEIVRQLKPDAIVCTHPFPSIIVSRLKRSGLDIPLCTVITDYDAHGSWISPEVNRYLVSTEDVRRKLMQHGVRSRNIQVTGIPVHPNFWSKQDRSKIRARWGLRAMPTVMVMGGGWGMMNSEELRRYFGAWRDRIQFLFCLGSNVKERARLEENEWFRHPNIRLIGFTREIDQLMDVSDLLITKPGGMTCTEAMAKGVPMLFYNPIPGQEVENFLYFTQNGLGEPLTAESVERRFQNLLESHPEMPGQRTAFPGGFDRYNPARCPQAVMQVLREERDSAAAFATGAFGY